MIPKYSNPSLLLNSTTIVSRAALNDDLEDEEQLPVETQDPEHAQLVARLENILKRTFQEVSPTHVEDNEASRKKKRRRKAEGDGQQDTEQGDAVTEEVAVPFRLLSGVSQPKPIVLAPKAPPKIISYAPAAEDTAAEAERRAARAREVAVDFAWVVAESKKPSICASTSYKKVVRLVPDTSVPLLVMERPKSPPKPPRVAQIHPEIEIKPSPHEHKTSCCPVVTAREPQETAKRKRRRGKVRDEPAIQATFWRPPPISGKALGYAWGYAGSRPWLSDEEPPRYERDTMKKAEYA
ncbi:hypothetical protein OH76DRAFT_1409797 [Lentinus brumalis]|uniref:Uncharacterized protein n=1 Tax=Lentinus brumalis TaxID=2498619 RepID=A0A371CU91_9APHY|nr:hypothetical protein OH76DRAFT_1409797 [Polyporus brumalis]